MQAARNVETPTDEVTDGEKNTVVDSSVLIARLPVPLAVPRKPSKIVQAVEIARSLLNSGASPLEVLVAAMRDETLPLGARLEAAKVAAPYLHPRLAQIEHSGGLTSNNHEAAIRELHAAHQKLRARRDVEIITLPTRRPDKTLARSVNNLLDELG